MVSWSIFLGGFDRRGWSAGGVSIDRFAHCPPILGSSTYLFLGFVDFVFFVPLAWVSFVPLLGLLQCRQLCPQSGYLGRQLSDLSITGIGCGKRPQRTLVV